MDKGGVEIREEDRIPPPSHTHTACRPCPVIASPHLQLFATPQDSLRPPPTCSCFTLQPCRNHSTPHLQLLCLVGHEAAAHEVIGDLVLVAAAWKCGRGGGG